MRTFGSKAGLFLAGICMHAIFPAAASAQAVDEAQRAGTWGFDLAGQDRAVKPGDSFFEFANGTYLRNLKIPGDRTWYGTVVILRDLSERRVHSMLSQMAVAAPEVPAATDDSGKAGAFYRSFMNTAAIEALDAKPLEPDLAAIRGANDRSALAALMGQSVDSLQSSIFGLSVFADLKDSDRNTLYVDQGGLGLPTRDYYLQASFAAKKAAYQSYAAKMLMMSDWPDAESKAKAIVDFETRIAEASWSAAERRDVEKIYSPTTMAALAAEAPGFDWNAFMGAAGVGQRTQLVALSRSALPKIASIFASTPVDVVQAYLAFHLIDNAAPTLSARFVDANFDFRGKTLSGLESNPVRWQRGVRTVSNILGHAIGKAYVGKYFTAETKAQTADMIANLKTAYRHRINGLDWMSAATKVKALEKLEAMEVQIGSPPKWDDYSSMQVRGDDLIGNIRQGAAWGWRKSLADLDRPVDRDEWGTTPQTVNAFNNSTTNKLIFPAAFIQAPVFDPLGDPAVNYGSLGAVIGHEISHGFDDQGRKFDHRGSLVDWWTAEDAVKFVASSKKFGAQYERFPILPDAKINGTLTMGENIADLGGVLAALDAYHASLGGKPAPIIDGLTGDQRFFLGYAQYYRNIMREDFRRQLLVSDPHSPDKARVDVVLPNVDAWYKAWNVKPGDKLYLPPAERIRVW